MPLRPVIVSACEQRVDDRLLGRLDRGVEERVDPSFGDDVDGLAALRASRLPVANARTRSPLEFSPAPPVRAIPSAERWATRSHWCGRSGASVATTTMIEPPGASPRSSGSGTRPRRAAADRDAVDREPAPALRGSPGRGRRRCGPPPALREAVPIPPLNPWQIIPVPPPTAPCCTGPAVARTRAPRTRARRERACPRCRSAGRRRSRRRPAGARRRGSRACCAATIASRTTPTENVLVRPTGVVSRPDSRIHSSPVSSPLPFRRCAPAKHGLAVGRGEDDGDAGADGVALDQRRVTDADARRRR